MASRRWSAWRLAPRSAPIWREHQMMLRIIYVALIALCVSTITDLDGNLAFFGHVR